MMDQRWINKAVGTHPHRWMYAGTTAALLSLVMVALSGCDSKESAQGGPQGAGGPMPVNVIKVVPSDVPVTGEWVGTLDGYVNAQIQPQVSGYLVQQTYREGSSVSKGQVLFQIDPRPFDAALQQAQGQLEQAKAQLGLAEINVNRDKPLAEARAIAKSQLDNETQQKLQAEAQVKSAEAAVATAKLNLGFTQVRSLISGIAGQATVQVGNLVSPQSVLTAVSQLDPIKVYFSISDGEYLSLVKRAHAGNGDLLKGAGNLPLTLTLSNGEVFPHKGHVVFIDRQMNQQTGAIRIAAAFPNPGNLLRPGQFGRVTADTSMEHNVIVVPQAAVTDLQGQKQVFAVGSDNKVHVLNVNVGVELGSNVVVQSGIPAGSQIIVDNLQKLREGAPVSPHPAPATPTDNPAGK